MITTKPDGTKIGHIVMIITLDTENNVLLLHRIDNNKWEPPKGSIDIVNGLSELYEAAAKREFIEETGLTQNIILKKLTEVEDKLVKSPTKILHIHATVFECRLDEMKPQITINADTNVEADHTEYRWVALTDIDKYDLYPDSFRGLITEFLNFK